MDSAPKKTFSSNWTNNYP